MTVCPTISHHRKLFQVQEYLLFAECICRRDPLVVRLYKKTMQLGSRAHAQKREDLEVLFGEDLMMAPIVQGFWEFNEHPQPDVQGAAPKPKMDVLLLHNGQRCQRQATKTDFVHALKKSMMVSKVMHEVASDVSFRIVSPDSALPIMAGVLRHVFTEQAYKKLLCVSPEDREDLPYILAAKNALAVLLDSAEMHATEVSWVLMIQTNRVTVIDSAEHLERICAEIGRSTEPEEGMLPNKQHILINLCTSRTDFATPFVSSGASSTFLDQANWEMTQPESSPTTNILWKRPLKKNDPEGLVESCAVLIAPPMVRSLASRRVHTLEWRQWLSDHADVVAQMSMPEHPHSRAAEEDAGIKWNQLTGCVVSTALPPLAAVNQSHCMGVDSWRPAVNNNTT